MATSIEERSWLEVHAEQDEEGVWVCKASSSLIRRFLGPRFVYTHESLGAAVSVVLIEQFLCPVFTHGRLPLSDGCFIHECRIVEF